MIGFTKCIQVLYEYWILVIFLENKTSTTLTPCSRDTGSYGLGSKLVQLGPGFQMIT